MTHTPAVVHPLVDVPIPPIGSPDLSDRKYEQYGRPTTPLVGRFLFAPMVEPGSLIPTKTPWHPRRSRVKATRAARRQVSHPAKLV